MVCLQFISNEVTVNMKINIRKTKKKEKKTGQKEKTRLMKKNKQKSRIIKRRKSKII